MAVIINDTIKDGKRHELRPEPIAIIGSACRFPGNVDTPSKLWNLLARPRDLGRPVSGTRFDASSFYHANNQYHGHANVEDFRAYFLDTGTERQFDAAFFGINPAEANVLDPQARLLLETTYEALEDAGQTMDKLQGSDTACYVGLMLGEYEQFMTRDAESIGTYHVLGTARSLVSNRLSYFFDWHGPSMTIDTACSSSLVAVHQAVQLLRSLPAPSNVGEVRSRSQSRVAVAAGTNLILDPMSYVSESKLQMLSPDGKGRMWDAAANGYARGEGVATVVLKRLCDAIADGDHVECIIRETGVSQDGKTRGITMPSASAQAALIRDTYRRAGLDINEARDRPQFFEAHGTGTPAGDPVEAEAIHTAFFENNGNTVVSRNQNDQILVGSIKTIIGHSEGAAGIAAILKASLALQHSAVPPNMLFKTLSPRVEPFTAQLRVPVSSRTVAWPAVSTGQPRRASVNNFGFGGTNAHAILESTEITVQTLQEGPVFVPFVFSAATDASLRRYLEAFLAYVDTNQQNISSRLHDLAYTLHSCRSRLPYATSVAASNATDLCARLREKLQPPETEGKRAESQQSLGVRINTPTRSDNNTEAVVLGVFTGQGAQWPQMGAELLISSPTAAAIVARLEARLSRLPPADRPSWSLREEMLRDGASSRIGEAELSQPLCTAVQIILVDLLRATGIKFAAVVGHSSGEIAAAYTAGIIGAEDAICIAYYRGLHVGRLLGTRGAMMAAGITAEDAEELVSSHVFAGRAAIAACNSSDSLTLSGDEDAIEELKILLEDEDKFARLLKVDKAYHSNHMIPMSEPYRESLRGLSIKVSEPSVPWISSVSGRRISGTAAEGLEDSYWVDNALRPVLFMQAVQGACGYLMSQYGSSRMMDLAVELGPHPTLKTPALQSIQDSTNNQQDFPYTGLLKRGAPDVVSLADGMGYIWTHLNRRSVDLESFDRFARAKDAKEKNGDKKNVPPSSRVVKGLPQYAWDHDTEYWHESRYSRATMTRGRSHPLLGHILSDACATDQELRWRQLISPAEVPWLNGHRLQNQAVFPAAGYVVLAIEACRELVHRLNSKSGPVVPVALIQVEDVEIHRAMTFDSDDARVEAIFALQDIITETREEVDQNKLDRTTILAKFKYLAASAGTTQKIQSDASLRQLASGRIKIFLDPAGTGTSIVDRKSRSSSLPARGSRPDDTLPIKAEDLYEALSQLEYSYSGPFRALHGLRRKLGHVTGWVSTPVAVDAGADIGEAHKDEEEQQLLIHPAMLDAAFQAVLLAKSAPFDGSLWSMHVPQRIARVSIDPTLCASHIPSTREAKLPLDAWLPDNQSTTTFLGDVDVYPDLSNEQHLEQLEQHAMIQVEGLECVPFSSATATEDKEPLSVVVWGPATPDAQRATLIDVGLELENPDAAEVELAQYLERVAYFYLQKLQRDISATDPCREPGKPLSRLFAFAEYVEHRVRSGKLPFWREEWQSDTSEKLCAAGLSHGHASTVDARLLRRIGENMADIATGKTTAIEVAMGPDRLLHQYYPAALGMLHNTRYLAATVAQITHRYPRCRVLEIGAGTGGATKAVLGSIGDAFASYAFTDVSSGFFPTAQEHFADRSWAGKMSYKVLDITRDPFDQPGFGGASNHDDQDNDDDGKYDLVIASMVLHATPSLYESLANTRRLLRPGGWLVVNEGVSNDVARVGAIFGAFPGWWLGAQTDGRLLGPHLPIDGWDRVLRETGFSGVDSSVPIIDSLLTPNTVFVSQVVDQRVSFLRAPLSVETTLAEACSSPQDLPQRDLIVVGGRSSATAGVTNELENILRENEYFSSVTKLRSLVDLSAFAKSEVGNLSLSAKTTVLSLSDVDEPLFQHLGQAEFNAIKTLLFSAGRVLWVTRARRYASPFANMTVGLLRSAILETPDLSFQFLDFEDADSPLEARTIIEALFRFEAGLAWTLTATDRQPPVLTTVELELVVEAGGDVLIPRIIPNKAMNDRYNSARRPIYKSLVMDVDENKPTKIVRLKSDEKLGDLYLEDEETEDDIRENRTCRFHTTHSLLTSTRSSQDGFQAHLNLARDPSNETLRVVLSRDIANSTVSLSNYSPVAVMCPENVVLPDTASKARFLRLIALNILASGIISLYHSQHQQELPKKHLNLMVYEPEPALGAMLKREAAARSSMTVTIMSSIMTRQRCEILGWSHVHPYAPTRQIHELLRLLPGQTSVLLVFGDSKAAARIVTHAPPCCEVVRDPEACLLGSDDSGESSYHVGVLENAVLCAQRDMASLTVDTHVVPVSQLDQPGREHPNPSNIVVDWEQQTAQHHRQYNLPIRLRPINHSQNLRFARNRTYWLAGLSGGLGLSLAEWMAARGAQHFLVTSRRPRVSRSWMDRMAARYGATVRVHANDLTDWSETSGLYRDACASGMPPVAGVAMGAMVLVDTSLRNMTLDDMNAVCAPKVQGSINLHRLFSGNEYEDHLELDFFVFFSSLTAATGNPGQSNYSAANLFMTSLAEQRRRMGLSASVIHIGVILGVGYVQEKTDTSKTNFNRTSGYSFAAEHDFHQQFAEAVVAGRVAKKRAKPQSIDKGARGEPPLEIALGLTRVSNRPDKKPFWFNNPTMTHFIRSEEGSKTIDGGDRANDHKAVPVKTLLLSATSREQMAQILTDAFLPFVCSIFQLPIPKGADEKQLQQHNTQMKEQLLDQIGLDSLLAVEIRSWWLKTAQVNLPVMKILSGLLSLPSKGVITDQSKPGRGVGDEDLTTTGTTSSPDTADAATPAAPSSSDDHDGVASIVMSDTSASDRHHDSDLDNPSARKSVGPGIGLKRTNGAAPAVMKWMDLSFSQSMFWYVLNFVGDQEKGAVQQSSTSTSSSLNHTGLFRLTGHLNIPALERTLELLGQRHEALRTCFRTDDDGTPKQGIVSHSTLHLERRAIRHEADAQQVADELQNQYAFDLVGGECLRAILLELPQDSHGFSLRFLLYGTHSLVLDGVSAAVFTRELLGLYEAMAHDKHDDATLKPLPESCQYPAFVKWQLETHAAGGFQPSLKFWRAQIEAHPSRQTQTLPVLRIGGDCGASSSASRPMQIHYENHRASVSIGVDTKKRVWEVCRAQKARAFHFFLAAFRALLQRLSTDDAEEVSIGIGDANRSWHEGAMDSLGPYINLLPLWFTTDADASFSHVLADTKARTDRALAHSDVPFQVLLNDLGIPRSSSHTPLFQAFFDYRQGMPKAKKPFGSDGCEIELVSFQAPGVPYDVSLDIIDDGGPGGAGDCHVTLLVRADLYSAHDTKVMVECYEKLVYAFASSSADPTLAEPDIYDQASVERALAFGRGQGYVPSRWSRGESEFIAKRIEAVARANPDHLALKLARGGQGRASPIFESEKTEEAPTSMTYSQMMGKTHAIAAAIQTAAAAADSAASTSPQKVVVAVCQEPTPDWLCSVLGVFMSGAVCVPCDAGTPLKRLVDMIDDSKASVLVVDRHIDAHALKELSGLGARQIVLVDDCIAEHDISSASVTFTAATVAPEDPAMILYTSGSTGMPKGIVLKHIGLANWAEHVPPLYMHSRHRNGTAETVLQQSSCGFDMSYLQSFFALAHGGTVCIVPRHLRADALAITEIMATDGITITQGVPSEYLNWLRYGDQEALTTALRTTWTTAMCGGEPGTDIVRDLIHELSSNPSNSTDYNISSRPRFYHMYGPTETTFIATAAELAYGPTDESSSSPPPIGAPLPNYTVYVLDDRGRVVPPGTQGEIYIGGAGVGAGYLERPALTAATFVPDPCAPAEFSHDCRRWNMMHRTGDNGRWREDGLLLFEGRKSGDTQHKLRGLRVDLQEIESVLRRESGGRLSDAVVSVRRRLAEGPEFLVAHVRFNPAWNKDEQQQRTAAVSSSSSETEDDDDKWLRRLTANLPLPRYMWPAATVAVAELPVTSSGKLDRRAVAALPLPDDPPVEKQKKGDMNVDSDDDLTETEARLKQIWEAIIFKNVVRPSYNITRDTDIFHVGGTSILLLQVQAQIRTAFGVRIPLVQLFTSSTLGAMACRIADIATNDTVITSTPRASTSEEMLVDWDEETSIPEATLVAIKAASAASSLGRPLRAVAAENRPLTVILTGATGLLGQGFLSALIAESNIAKIHCLGVRNAESRTGTTFTLLSHPKVVVHPGDLSLPCLGLPSDDKKDSPTAPAAIFNPADGSDLVIIHNGADTSHLKTYQSLRAANLQATKELVGLCSLALAQQTAADKGPDSTALPPRLPPIHYISTASVLHYSGLERAGEISAAAHPPPLGDGYSASKWASERFLERVHEASGGKFPVYIHRPTSVQSPQVRHDDGNHSQTDDIVQNLLRFSRLAHAVPVSPKLRGFLNLVPVESVVASVVRRVQSHGQYHSGDDQQGVGGVRYLHERGDVDIPLDNMKSYVEQLLLARITPSDKSGGAGGSAVDELPIDEWTTRAAHRGMAPMLVAFFEEIARQPAVTWPLLVEGSKD